MRFDRQHNPSRSIALRYRIGVAAALLLVTFLGAGSVRADGLTTVGDLLGPSAPPLSTLVKFGDRQFEITYGDGVSLDPVSTAVVRKVEFGRVSEVNIATTATGTYSSDALTSRHVLYPGIDVAQVYDESGADWPWHRSLPAGPGHSIFSIDRDAVSGGIAINAITDRGVRSCMMHGSFASCYRTY